MKNLAVAVVVGAVVVAYLWLETNSLVLGISQLAQCLSHLYDAYFKCQCLTVTIALVFYCQSLSIVRLALVFVVTSLIVTLDR